MQEKTLSDNQKESNLIGIDEGFLLSLLRDLSATDLRVFLFLYSKFYREGVSSMILSIKEIVQDSNFKRQTVIRGLNSLDESGFIIREKRKSDTEGFLPSRLTIPILQDLGL